MDWSSTVRFLQCVLVYSSLSKFLVISANSVEHSNDNDRSSGFVFKLIPTPGEEKSPIPTQSNYRQTTESEDATTDYDYTTYPDSWTDMTTDEESSEDSTTVSSDAVVDILTTDLASSTTAVPANKNDIEIDRLRTTATVPQAFTARPRFIFNIIRATITEQVTKHSVDIFPTTKSRDIISRDPILSTAPQTRKLEDVTTTERPRTGVGRLPKNRPPPSSNAGKDKGINKRPRPISFYEDEETTEDTGILLGHSPFLWKDWYWVFVALFIVLFLIVGCCCQICIARRQNDRRRAKCIEEAEDEDASQSVSESSVSHGRVTGGANQSVACSTKSTRSTDQDQSTKADESQKANNCQDIPVVITIPDPMLPELAVAPSKHGESARHESQPENRKPEHPPSEKYDVRIEIGNETIIKSSEVTGTQRTVDPTKKRDPTRKTHTETHPAIKRRGGKRRDEAPKRKVVHNTRDHKHPRDEISKKDRTRPSRKNHRRGDTRAKISDNTKAILEAARDLDGILAAITSLTQEYPIPEHSKAAKSNRANENPPDLKQRKRPTDNSTRPQKNTRTRRPKATAQGQEASKKIPENAHARNKKSSIRRNKKQKRSKEKSKAKGENVQQSEKKVPTLVKEELPTFDAVKNEQRRRRLERDLKKLQNYHNTQFSNSQSSE